MYDIASQFDEKLLNDLLNSEKYRILNSYDIHVALFVKYGKRDKEGNLKSPAITKNGVAVPAQIKVVSNFNRITDDTDVKIILNAELWEELSKEEKISTLDNMLAYLQIKEDKTGEPLTISESCDKVQLKLKKPDFYCEGFLSLIEDYGKAYIPYQDAEHIINNLKNDGVKNDDTIIKEVSEEKEIKPKRKKSEKQKNNVDEHEDVDAELNLDDIEI
jgi:hypothetical protein